jgi:hypothetical protein
MSIHELPPLSRDGSDGAPLDVQTWRRRRLLEAGFPAGLAGGVAADPRFDLHALLELVDRGCSPGLAVRILAPLPRAEES